MLGISRRMSVGELKEENHWRIWIWSDLHLGHDETISYFGRPFENPRQMDDALFASWKRTVTPGDTIICLGDVAVTGLWGTSLRRLRRAPGRKILVIGNHEINRLGEVDIDGFDAVHSTLHASGDPPLLLTHMPLRNVPEGCVNVHGHVHNRQSPSCTQHINVSVEQLRYRPRPWEAIRALARHMVAGGVATNAHAVQLSLSREHTLLQKRIAVYGDRDAGGGLQTFERMPLQWERTVRSRKRRRYTPSP